MNKTQQVNQKQIRAINKLSPRNLWWLDQHNKWNLWEIRGQQTHPYTFNQLVKFQILIDENNEAIDDFIEGRSWL